MANCPKCKHYIDVLERSLVEIHDVDDEGEVSRSVYPRWEYTKFRHECGHVFDVESKFGGSYINIVGGKEDEDA